jgi:hypothetical protein
MSKSTNAANIMNPGITRSIFRWVHIIFGIPIIGYIYSPFQELPNYAPVVRNVAVPVIAISGLWMWKGHVVRRLISKRRLDKTLQRTAAGMSVKTRQEFEA